MRHGEYVALGKVEAALKTSGAVANIVVYGSGTILMPIAIACPVEKGKLFTPESQLNRSSTS